MMRRSGKSLASRAQVKLRTIMVVVAIIAIDAAGYSQFVWHGSRIGLAVFAVLTLGMPLALLIVWIARKVDGSGNTLY
jgi:hypothetical protein